MTSLFRIFFFGTDFISAVIGVRKQNPFVLAGKGAK